MSEQGTPRPPEDPLARAEDLVGRMTGEVGRLSARLAGRVREEAEDIWAEARALRDRGASGGEPPR